MLNAFTVDVEDYFHVSAFERYVKRSDWGHFPSRVVANTRKLLNLLNERGIRGTFFVLGWVAWRHPELVREIDQAGHEIGSHSYWHRLVYQQTPDEFRQDLRDSRHVLEDIIQKPVTAYRAPSFSITARSMWALPILVEEGILADSSIFPVVHDRYGIPGARRDIHRIETDAGSLWEFPPTIARIAGVNLPVAGGGYFRLYPFHMTRQCLRAARQQLSGPFMFYTHPWEIDPDQPRHGHGSRLARFRHYVGLANTERKLARLLGSFHFASMRDLLADKSGASMKSAS